MTDNKTLKLIGAVHSIVGYVSDLKEGGITQGYCDRLHDHYCKQLIEALQPFLPKEEGATIPPEKGWVEWKGGVCPVESTTLVEVIYSNGRRYTQSAMLFQWKHGVYDKYRGVIVNLIAYRIVTKED